MEVRTMEIAIALTFGLLAILAVVRYRDLWILVRRATGGTRRLLVAFLLMVMTLAVTMGVWAVALAVWPAPRSSSTLVVMYALLWAEHIFIVLIVNYLYVRMTNNGH